MSDNGLMKSKTPPTPAPNYDDYYKCRKCGRNNAIKTKGMMADIICEAETTCKACGHIDYWAYGFYSLPLPTDS